MARYRIAESRSLLLDLCLFWLPATGCSTPINIATQSLDSLPSLSMCYTLGEQGKLRTVFPKSITRPSFKQLSPNNLLYTVRTSNIW